MRPGESSLTDCQDYVVCKFGGTSVSSAANWHNIAGVVRERIGAGLRPLIVHSALSGITDQLEALLAAALRADHSAELAAIEAKHRILAAQLKIEPGGRFEAFFAELGAMAEELARLRVLDDALRARVMAMGELLATCFVNP